MTLTAFIDDSAQGQIFVYAGYFARLSDWEHRFTPQWQTALDAEPKLNFFKMNEAMGRGGPWHCMTDRQRLDRTREFYRIASSNIIGGVSVILPLDLFNEIICSSDYVHRRQKNKHFFVVYNVMHDLLRGCDQLGIDEPINFVFDDQSRGKDQIYAAWDSFAKDAPVPIHRFGNSPRFANDKHLHPLQAADMCAWIIRRNAIRFLSGQTEETYPWSDLKVVHKRITRTWDREQLENYVERCKVKNSHKGHA